MNLLFPFISRESGNGRGIAKFVLLIFFFSFSTRLNKNQGRNAISKGYIRSRVTLLREFITLLTNGVLILLQRSRVRVASNVYR